MDVLIKTNKFHKIEIKRRYIRKYNYYEQTIRTLLTYYLSLACNKYNTESKFNKFLGQNYDLRYYVSINSIGNYSYISQTLSCVDPKYINDDNYNINFIINSFYECINPVIKFNTFDKKLFNRAKEMYLSDLLYELENEHKKAIELTLNTYYNKTNDMISNGDINILNTITIKELYNYYLTIIEDEKIDYIGGNCDIKIRNNSKLSVKNDFLYKNKSTFEPYIEKKAKTNQCYLQIIYNVNSFTNTFDFFAANIINYEFGGKANSKLFQIVREKYGLCYHISSSYYGSRGIFMVTAAINKNDLNEVVKVIDNVFNTLLDEFDMTPAKKFFKSQCLSDKDKLKYILNNHFVDNYFITDYLSKNEADNYDKVTIDDIKRIYNNIKKELTFVYGGDNNE